MEDVGRHKVPRRSALKSKCYDVQVEGCIQIVEGLESMASARAIVFAYNRKAIASGRLRDDKTVRLGSHQIPTNKSHI